MQRLMLKSVMFVEPTELDIARLGGGWRHVGPKLDRGIMDRGGRAGSRASQG